MPLEDDVQLSDEEDLDEEHEVAKHDVEEGKVNGETEVDKDHVENSTSDIEDNDIRETLSDDSDQVQASIYLIHYFMTTTNTVPYITYNMHCSHMTYYMNL